MKTDYEQAVADAKARVARIDRELVDVDYQLRRSQAEVDRLLGVRKKMTDEANKIRYILNLPAAQPTPAMEAIPV